MYDFPKFFREANFSSKWGLGHMDIRCLSDAHIYIDQICTRIVAGTIVLNVYKDSKISQDPVLWNHAPYTKEWATAAQKPKTSVSYKLYVLRKKCIFFNILITIFQNDFFLQRNWSFYETSYHKINYRFVLLTHNS